LVDRAGIALDDYANLKDGGINALVEDTAGRAELSARLKHALYDYNERFPAYCLFADERRDRQAIWTLPEAMAGVRIDGKVEAPVTATPVGEPAAAAPA
jgi:hypothetical protein